MAELPFGQMWGVEALAGAMIKKTRRSSLSLVRSRSGLESSEIKDMWLISADQIVQAVEKDRDQQKKGSTGGKPNSTEERSRRFVKAVCCGHVQYLKETDPGRIRRMLRNVAARIRRTVHFGSRDVRSARSALE